MSIGIALLIWAGQAIATTPLPPEFVDLRKVDSSILQDIRYHTTHNFIGKRIEGYPSPKCYLTRPAARSLKLAQTALKKERLSLKVYDCFRPQRAVDHFVRWARDKSDTKMKATFYPNVPKSRLFQDGYIASKSSHSRGSTVDITLVKLPARAQPLFHPPSPACFSKNRYRDNTVDMGTSFDCFSPLSHTLNPNIPGAAKKNRMRLVRVLRSVGFKNYAKEWWHFTLRDEPFPKRTFDFPIQ